MEYSQRSGNPIEFVITGQAGPPHDPRYRPPLSPPQKRHCSAFCAIAVTPGGSYFCPSVSQVLQSADTDTLPPLFMDILLEPIHFNLQCLFLFLISSSYDIF